MAPGRWMRRMTFLVMAGAALAAAPASARVTPAGPDPDDKVEEILVQVRLGRYLQRTILSFRTPEQAFLPVAEFLQLTGMKILEVSDSNVIAQWFPQQMTLKATSGDSVFYAGRREISVPTGGLMSVGGVLYATTDMLARALDVEIQVDWSALTITVANPERLPLIVRLHREAMRRALARRQAPPPPDLIVGPDRTQWQGLVMDYNVLIPTDNLSEGTAVGTALGTNAFGGSLKMAARSGYTGQGRSVDVEGSWLGVWPSDPYLKQLRVGDGRATGPQAMRYRGISLSNSPYIRPIPFGTTRYEGGLGPGWEAEAFRGGELVGYQPPGVDERFSFDIPVGYGENPIEVVAYGPYGEVRQFNQTYRVSHSLLQDDKLEYGVSAGACRLQPCDGLFNADVRYGLTRRWTAGAGVNRFWRSGSDLTHPYVSLIGNPRNAWTLELQSALSAYTLGRVRYEPSLDLRVVAEHGFYDSSIADPIITVRGQRSRTQLGAIVRPIPGYRPLHLEARAIRSERTTLTTSQVLFRASYQPNNLRLLPFVRLAQTSVPGLRSPAQTFLGLDAVLLTRGRGMLKRSWLQGGIEFTGSGRVNRVTLDFAKSIQTGTRIEAGIVWANDAVGPVFRLGFSSLLSGVRLNTRVAAQTRGDVVATQSVEGSVLYNQSAGNVSFNAGPSIERSGVTGIVFLDENGNGLREIDEPGLPDVRVIIGNTVVESDSSGRYQQWDLLAFDPVLLSVDSTSLASPLWVSHYGSVSLFPEPNTFRTIDLPIIEAGVLEGRLVPEGARVPGLGGVELELRDLAGGTSQVFRTFTDGGFYLMGVRPGTYELAVTSTYTEALGITAERRRITILPAMDGDFVENIELVVTRP